MPEPSPDICQTCTEHDDLSSGGRCLSSSTSNECNKTCCNANKLQCVTCEGVICVPCVVDEQGADSGSGWVCAFIFHGSSDTLADHRFYMEPRPYHNMKDVVKCPAGVQDAQDAPEDAPEEAAW